MTGEKKRGGNRKFAPEGYYTSKQARERLGLSTSTFIYYVKIGKIKRYVPPLKKEGFYAKKEIDQLATEMALFLHTIEEKAATLETRVARSEDADGIVSVLTIMGWQTATAEQRIAWYAVNPFIDYVVLWHGEVMGYIFAAPYKPAVLKDMMSGKKRSWHVIPNDILPYRKGKQDIYIGIATRQDIPNNTRFGFRLISGFLSFLMDLAGQGIVIRRMYAVSAEPDGQKLCHDLGFMKQPTQPGDVFRDARFILDLETSDSHFAKRYREAIQQKK